MKIKCIQPGTFLYFVFIRTLNLVLKLWMWTLRKNIIGDGTYISGSKELNKKLIVAFWHEKILGISYLFPRSCCEKCTAVVSRSSDGQIISDLLSFQGLDTVRGSANKKGQDKGGAQVLIQSLRILKKQERYLCIVPDGPRGPAHLAQPGVIVLSSKSSVPILPISINYSSYFCLSSWDKLQVPYPFSKVDIVIGEELSFEKGIRKDEELMKEGKLKLEGAINSLS